ncbi:PEPxxWA-CTERM sorting domain-containing protein [Phenylobacterium sp.]|uniref:PEPxxWA-CTERM sorting domain-containing protein n=1 Tax=Phenylobacterium sp. TaxID=1871053 RepID=UPI0025F08D18|nr:PEPxxWA-CTERM sorting domain-containing protein [Phenylobacterium sp.]
MRNVLAATAAVAAIAFAGAPAHAVTVLDVGPGDGCGKTTCFNDDGVFTQTWSAKDATGPMTVGKFLMARGVLGSLDGSTFRISFQAGGQELGTWGSYNMAGIGGDELSFDGLDFVWNPEDGDLTLVLEIIKPSKTTGLGSISSFGGGGDQPEAFKPFGPGPSDIGGPNDSPNDGPVGEPSPAPEPAAWALMIAGFGMAGATLRQRRRVVA